jgi:hypothetical protein
MHAVRKAHSPWAMTSARVGNENRNENRTVDTENSPKENGQPRVQEPAGGPADANRGCLKEAAPFFNVRA